METEKILQEGYRLRIDKEGNWFYNDTPIINRNIYLFFNRHIVDAAQGGYLLQIGSETCRLIVEDTPYVVVRIEHLYSDTEQRAFFKIRLNDETEEELDLASFYIGKANVPYCTVKKGRFPARFLRSPYYRLASHIQQEDGPEERFYLLLNNQKFYISTTHKDT